MRKANKRGKRSRNTKSVVPMVPKYRTEGLGVTFGSINSAWNVLDLPYITNTTDVVGRWTRKLIITEFGMDGLLVGGQSNFVTDDPFNAVRIIVAVVAPGFVSADMAVYSISSHIQPGVVKIERKVVDRIINLQVPAKDSVGYIPASSRVSVRLPMNVTCVYDQAGSDFPTAGSSLAMMMVSDSSVAPHPGFTSGHWWINFRDCWA